MHLRQKCHRINKDDLLYLSAADDPRLTSSSSVAWLDVGAHWAEPLPKFHVLGARPRLSHVAQYMVDMPFRGRPVQGALATAVYYRRQQALLLPVYVSRRRDKDRPSAIRQTETATSCLTDRSLDP
jgi:hypothetical protein